MRPASLLFLIPFALLFGANPLIGWGAEPDGMPKNLAFWQEGLLEAKIAGTPPIFCAPQTRGLAPRSTPEQDRRQVLWRIIQECVSAQEQHQGTGPCQALEPGFGLLKDLKGKQHYLLIPTTQITGLEVPLAGASHTPSYFEAAIRLEKPAIEAKLARKVPLEALGFAINSSDRRSQDQLHIHVDCVDSRVSAELKKREAQISAQWGETRLEFDGMTHRVRKVEGDSLKENPIASLAQEWGKQAPEELKHHSLAVIPSVSKDGKPLFYILDSRSTERPGAHAEDLLDPDCTVLPSKQAELPSAIPTLRMG